MNYYFFPIESLKQRFGSFRCGQILHHTSTNMNKLNFSIVLFPAVQAQQLFTGT